MSRHAPIVILKHENHETVEEIIEADSVYAVFYRNEPFNIKNTNKFPKNSAPKYKKNSFANVGHAKNLRDKLNDLFNTTDFAVVELVAGAKIK
jgi:hypothetical protein